MSYLIEKNIPVPMRDGVRLATDLYRPAGPGPFPTLIVRLPYNKESGHFIANPLLDVLRIIQAGYAVLLQDCRGRYASEGTFVPFSPEGEDGVDTIAWAASQPWSTGDVGLLGMSYLGTTQWLPAALQPEALRAMAPAITPSDLYGTLNYRQGAFQLGNVLGCALSQAPEEARRQIARGQASQEELHDLLSALDHIQERYCHLPLVDQPLLKKFFPPYFDWLEHSRYDDYWQHINPKESYHHITVPALHIAGWYDLFLGGVLENYRGMKERGGSLLARQHQRLIIGPWSHLLQTGSFPEREYGIQADIAGADATGEQIRWFDHWLKGEDNGVEDEKPVKIFVMGLNQWREEQDWPLPDTQYRPYYLHSAGMANSAHGDGLLSPEGPGAEAEDVYLYDPRRPVPTVGGAHLMPGYNIGPRDQRSVEERDDVLCYTTPILEHPLEVTGPIELVLYISSSARDTDFTGKLVDVYPDGRAEILTDGILRTRYRDSLSDPTLMEASHIYELHIDLWATSNLFKAGHRIRLEVSSSNFPRFDRNTNTGGTIAMESGNDFLPAVNRVYHTSACPSHLLLPVIERNEAR